MEQTVEYLGISHTDVLNFLIKKYGYKTYLEIGVGDPRENFCLIECEDKVAVDPYFDFVDVPNYDEEAIKEINKHVKFRLPSDEFFNYLRENKTFDIIFIDGLHTEEQCDRDIRNAIKHLSAGGAIVVHDTNPYSSQQAASVGDYVLGEAWSGDVYKSVAKLKYMGIPHITLGEDHGITVIRCPEGFEPDYSKYIEKMDITYDEFNERRPYFLNMVSREEFLDRI